MVGSNGFGNGWIRKSCVGRFGGEADCIVFCTNDNEAKSNIALEISISELHSAFIISHTLLDSSTYQMTGE